MSLFRLRSFNHLMWTFNKLEIVLYDFWTFLFFNLKMSFKFWCHFLIFHCWCFLNFLCVRFIFNRFSKFTYLVNVYLRNILLNSLLNLYFVSHNCKRIFVFVFFIDLLWVEDNERFLSFALLLRFFLLFELFNFIVSLFSQLFIVF